MIVIHGVCQDSALTVWAETGRAAGATLAAEYPETERPRAHPFAAAAGALAETLRSADPDLRVTARRVRPVAMWLPSQIDAPAPSSTLIAPADGAGGPTHIAPWVVPALRLEPAESVALLRAVSRDWNLAAGAFAGTDLRYWAEDAFRFAAALAVRQQFLPGIAIGQRDARAVWEPVFTGDDGEALGDDCRSHAGVGASGDGSRCGNGSRPSAHRRAPPGRRDAARPSGAKHDHDDRPRSGP